MLALTCAHILAHIEFGTPVVKTTFRGGELGVERDERALFAG